MSATPIATAVVVAAATVYLSRGPARERTANAARRPSASAASTVTPISARRYRAIAFVASVRTAATSSGWLFATRSSALRSTLRTSTRRRTGSRIVSNRAPQSTSGT